MKNYIAKIVGAQISKNCFQFQIFPQAGICLQGREKHAVEEKKGVRLLLALAEDAKGE
ncbi:MAG: hypothetical protein QXO25_02985 [Candidatus Bathyarchaeia archaeon]